ncbi:MAG TPA: HypC/HybG/HupF family hydrogenase formation chaperone [Patescibacteria group bacterium]|nr:HypC/HybG/HupF family hydrogenase formation chaperone [Patescibacteria group bacterium]
MCLAFPGKVIKIEGRKASVEYPGETREALIGEENVKVGDMVLVQMGIIIQIITKSQADKAEKAWNIE